MKPKPPHATAVADRIPVSQKVAYGMGAVVTIVAVNSVVQLTNLVYIVGLGISAIWIGWAQAFPDCGMRSSTHLSVISRTIPVPATAVEFPFSWWEDC